MPRSTGLESFGIGVKHIANPYGELDGFRHVPSATRLGQWAIWTGPGALYSF